MMKRTAVHGAALTLFGLICLVTVICGAGLLYASTTTIPLGFAGHLMEVYGVSLRVLQEGSGHGILVIHGSPGILAAASRPRLSRRSRPGGKASTDA
jgi:hypothetical protein